MSAASAPAYARRRAARLAAIQALYEIEISGAAPAAVVEDFIRRRWVDAGSPETADAVPDFAFLDRLVRGVIERSLLLDAAIAGALSVGWTVERLEVILRALLRAGAYELEAMPEIPPRVVIDEYVRLAHAFFGGREPGMVNAVLDRLAAKRLGCPETPSL